MQGVLRATARAVMWAVAAPAVSWGREAERAEKPAALI